MSALRRSVRARALIPSLPIFERRMRTCVVASNNQVQIDTSIETQKRKDKPSSSVFLVRVFITKLLKNTLLYGIQNIF